MALFGWQSPAGENSPAGKFGKFVQQNQALLGNAGRAHSLEGLTKFSRQCLALLGDNKREFTQPGSLAKGHQKVIINIKKCCKNLG